MVLKNEFIDRLSKKGYTKRDAETIIEDVTNTITELMAEGNDVMFRGFGTFEVRDRKERESINPQTGERMVIPAYRTAHFTAGKVLKRAVQEGKAEG